MGKTANDVLEFWREAGPKKWWKKDLDFDEAIKTEFSSTLSQAANGELDHWYGEPTNTLALIIVLDQFSRNLHRQSPLAFSNDPRCLKIVHKCIEDRIDENMPDDLRPFCYLPLMHSELLADQHLCIDKLQAIGAEPNMKSAIEHKDIIERFGRFPHRNAVLGRETTPEEQAFLDEGGFAG